MNLTYTPELATYVANNMSEVQGWAGSGQSVLLVGHLASLQDDCDGLGAFEIGVHHGRYLIALHTACQPGSRSLGMDLFADQSKNVDRSGAGDLEIARSNVDRFAREPELVELRQIDSLNLNHQSIESIRQDYGSFRLASVDGGHSAVHVVRDVSSTSALVSPGGLIAVDDFFHPNFPGVTEGLYSLLNGHALPFVPFLVTRKKIFLCHASYVPLYSEKLQDGWSSGAFEGESVRRVRIAGYAALSVYI